MSFCIRQDILHAMVWSSLRYIVESEKLEESVQFDVLLKHFVYITCIS